MTDQQPDRSDDLENQLRQHLSAAYRSGANATDPQRIAADVRTGVARSSRRRTAVTSVAAAAAVVALTAGVTVAVNGQRDAAESSRSAAAAQSSPAGSAAASDAPGAPRTDSIPMQPVPEQENCGTGDLPKMNQGWSYLDNAPIAPRTPAATVWTGSTMLVVGRAGNASCSASDARQGAAYDLKTKAWSKLPDAPSPIGATGNFGSVWTGSDLVVWTAGADTALYSPSAQRWRTAPPLPFDVRGSEPDDVSHQTEQTVWDGKRIVVLAQDVKRPNHINVAALDPATLRWAELPGIDLAPGRNADQIAAAVPTEGADAGSVYLRIGWWAGIADRPAGSGAEQSGAARSGVERSGAEQSAAGRLVPEQSAAAPQLPDGAGPSDYGTVSYRLAAGAKGWAAAPSIGQREDFGQLYAAGDTLVWAGGRSSILDPKASDEGKSQLSVWTLRLPDGSAERVKTPGPRADGQWLEPGGTPIWTGDGLIYLHEYPTPGGATAERTGESVRRWSLGDDSWASLGLPMSSDGDYSVPGLVWTGSQLVGWGTAPGITIDTGSAPASGATQRPDGTSLVPLQPEPVVGIGLQFTPTEK
ncbi:hypothetical protein [Nakamurella aerolata]|uniref:Galactose oxidase n=1 Tax=Nakamurella aerolata TaxID=1656892 RepID=A0A849AA72_9ACTN|nr:hypothetical protein [Nakamurella aerolata]NNG36857.1 hypothetical protein [Nakamurella aerolata]